MILTPTNLPWSDERHDIMADLRAFAEWARTTPIPAYQPLILSPRNAALYSRLMRTAQWRMERERANREAKRFAPMRVDYRRRARARRRRP